VRLALAQYRALVEKKLAGLLPTFLTRRRDELESLRAALAAGDFERLRQLGHRMRGVGGSYGFDHVTTLGGRIEQCARDRDAALIVELIADYADYLANVRIEYA
jgi:histidine phosphotransfer protein HptB